MDSIPDYTLYTMTAPSNATAALLAEVKRDWLIDDGICQMIGYQMASKVGAVTPAEKSKGTSWTCVYNFSNRINKLHTNFRVNSLCTVGTTALRSQNFQELPCF